MPRYEFNKTRHIHTLDGKPLTGVTTILQVVAKPALISWAANMAVDYIRSKIIVGGGHTTIIPTESLDEARTAHTKKKEKAGTWGTEIHAWIEQWIMGQIMGGRMVVPLDGEKGKACEHFVRWATDNKVVFKESEKNVWSEVLWIGGICDIVCEIDGDIYLVDIKTGSDIYVEAWWQLALYQICLEEMGLYPNIKGHIVINLKKDGSFTEKRSISIDDSKKAGLACLDIYRIKAKMENTI